MSVRRTGSWALGFSLALALVLSACSNDDPAPAAKTVAAPKVALAAKLFPGESARLTGRITPAGRNVILQRQVGGTWVDVTESRTEAKGRYELAAPAAPTASTYRVFSPQQRVADKLRGERTSASVVVRAVTPKVAVDVISAPVTQASAALGAAALYPVTTTVTPARVVDVTVQRRTGSTWQTVATGRTDATGTHVAGVDLDPAAPGTYRSVVSAGNGAADLRSRAATTSTLDQTFNDDFDSARVYNAQWRTRLQEYAGSRLCSKPAPEATSLGRGVVTLRVLQDSPKATKRCPYGTFKNAMIATRVDGFSSFNTTYGTFAARVKFQSGRGQHGAFWLQGPSITGAEIDTAEYYGDGRPDGGLSTLVHHTVRGKVTSSGGIQPQARKMFDAGMTPSNGYHIYSVSWTPRGYTFRLDGKLLFRTAKPHISNVDEFMVLSLLSSDWELPNLDRTALATDSVMTVDWVRAWQ